MINKEAVQKILTAGYLAGYMEKTAEFGDKLNKVMPYTPKKPYKQRVAEARKKSAGGSTGDIKNDTLRKSQQNKQDFWNTVNKNKSTTQNTPKQGFLGDVPLHKYVSNSRGTSMSQGLDREAADTWQTWLNANSTDYTQAGIRNKKKKFDEYAASRKKNILNAKNAVSQVKGAVGSGKYNNFIKSNPWAQRALETYDKGLKQGFSFDKATQGLTDRQKEWLRQMRNKNYLAQNQMPGNMTQAST